MVARGGQTEKERWGWAPQIRTYKLWVAAFGVSVSGIQRIKCLRCPGCRTYGVISFEH